MNDDRPSDTEIESSPSDGGYRSQQERISVDEIHRLLASERRRNILSYLATHSEDPVYRDDLVDIAAESEYPDPGPATHRTRAETDLHHIHLPKLADAGVIEYGLVAETVEYNASGKLESLLATSNAVEGTE